MKEDKNLDSLFEAARNETPQVSFEEVSDTFVSNVPSGFFGNVKELLFNNISLNSALLISSGSIIIATVGFILLSKDSPKELPKQVSTAPAKTENHNNTNTSPTTKDKFTVQLDETPQIKKQKIAQISTSESPEKSETLEIKNSTMSPMENKEVVEIKDSLNNKIGNDLANAIITENKTSTTNNIPAEKNNLNIPPQNQEEGSTKPISSMPINNTNPKIGGYGKGLKFLRQQLLYNLTKDKLIRNKRTKVVFEITPGNFLINGKKIPNSLTIDYMYILQNSAVFPRENRQIRIIDKKFIMIGDMTSKGFTGKGVGSGAEVYFNDFVGEMEIAGEGFKAVIHPDELLPDPNNPQVHNNRPGNYVNSKKGTSERINTPKQQLTENLLQKILKTEQLDSIFEKDKSGNFYPLLIITNHHFSDIYHIYRNGKKAKILHDHQLTRLNNGLSYIDVQKFKLKSKKAQMEFKYNGNDVSIKLKKINDIWKFTNISIKGKDGKYVLLKY